MNDSFSTYEYIDRYLSGELEPEERKAFEQYMDRDPDFAAKVERALLSKGVAYKEGLDEWKAGKLQQLTYWEATDRSSRTTAWLKIAAAIAILLMLGAGIFSLSSKSQSPEALFAEYYAIKPSPTYRQQGGNSPLKEGFRAFNQHQYEEALRHWDQFSMKTDQFTKDEISYYRGLSYLELHMIAQAREQLEQISDHSFLSKAQWYLALIALKEGEVDQARGLLEIVGQTPSSFQEQARELLEKL